MPLVNGRKRRPQPEDDESVETTPEPQTQRQRTHNASDEEDFDGGGHMSATQADGTDDMVKKLVRLALACEYQRRPIKRTDISEKVLGSNSRQFRTVFQAAQAQLQIVFGMQMVELPAKEKTTLQQRRAAQKSTAPSKTVASWVLQSTLPPAFREMEILQPPSAPTAAEESSLPEAKMERYLTRLNLQDTTPVREHDKTEKLFKRLEKDGYLIRVKEGTGTGEDDIYWTVGPRGKVEVGEVGAKGLAKAVFGDMPDEADEADLERKLNRSLGISDVPTVPREATTAGEPAPRRRRKRPQEQEDAEESSEGEADEGDEDEDEQ